jgi:hypothetical protein
LRQIGPIGTTARVVVGLLLLVSGVLGGRVEVLHASGLRTDQIADRLNAGRDVVPSRHLLGGLSWVTRSPRNGAQKQGRRAYTERLSVQ